MLGVPFALFGSSFFSDNVSNFATIALLCITVAVFLSVLIIISRDWVLGEDIQDDKNRA